MRFTTTHGARIDAWKWNKNFVLGYIDINPVIARKIPGTEVVSVLTDPTEAEIMQFFERPMEVSLLAYLTLGSGVFTLYKAITTVYEYGTLWCWQHGVEVARATLRPNKDLEPYSGWVVSWVTDPVTDVIRKSAVTELGWFLFSAVLTGLFLRAYTHAENHAIESWKGEF